MESALASLIIAMVALYSVFTIAQVYLTSQDAILTSGREMQERTLERVHTDIDFASTQVLSSGSVVEAILRNQGSVKLADFQEWDVIVHYYTASGGYHVKWLPFTPATPTDNQWTVAGLYLQALSTPEVYEPDIFNPDEEMVIQIRLLPPVGPNTTNQLTVITENGVAASTFFTR
ncbi:hypothetical protein FKZ61_014875 [Litorilinea aerophila]|uniref:Conserved flagellar protein F immunoglobulin-like domain-containing protein n=1 Tax=Litorilinea aerophila TaxID=1204385 RepID=A0A540VDR5_9CHLR|nr:hypothetical protein [Litorilinea aerophila]MCC9077387.1 hypothetical protein [Litorilinea aerophila]OUC06591.1 hypothetical protein RY27_20095 [Litorilinea aerophila]